LKGSEKMRLIEQALMQLSELKVFDSQFTSWRPFSENEYLYEGPGLNRM
jgi:hypothetical protein